MSLTSNEVDSEGTPTYLDTGDPGRTVTDFASNTTAAKDYFPVWLNCLADDVTLEGAMMNGAVRGPEAVRALVGFVRTLYEDQQFSFAGPVRRQRLPRGLQLPGPRRARRQRRARQPQRGRPGRTTSWSTTARVARSCSCPGWSASTSRAPPSRSTSRPVPTDAENLVYVCERADQHRPGGANGVDYAYRELGDGAVPLVLLQHFRGNLDNWDPPLLDALAANRRVVVFDNVGVGGSSGVTPGHRCRDGARHDHVLGRDGARPRRPPRVLDRQFRRAGDRADPAGRRAPARAGVVRARRRGRHARLGTRGHRGRRPTPARSRRIPARLLHRVRGEPASRQRDAATHFRCPRRRRATR